MITLNNPYSRFAAAIIAALIANVIIISGLPLSLRFSAPAKKERNLEAIRLADYRKPPPPPPKKEEIKKEIVQKQVQPKLKNFMPKMDVDALGGNMGSMFQFDMGLAKGVGDLTVSVGMKIWDESKVDSKPVAIFRTKPVYPAKAQSEMVTGRVAFKFMVDRDGMVKDVEILQAQPQGMFDEATINAVKQWRFQPAKVKGTAVACWVQTAINYELE